jgi:hypothetical protein
MVVSASASRRSVRRKGRAPERERPVKVVLSRSPWLVMVGSLAPSASRSAIT